jgi:acetylornithine/succinyldiaminopimelate/putrescine aminotransferase
MASLKQLFYDHQGRTSDAPIGIEIVNSEGIYLYDKEGKDYIDLVSGVSVSNLGHKHPVIIKAIKDQLDKYSHLMVYGEFIQEPQVRFAELLAQNIPDPLSSTYFVNSGSEAIEGALKLAKRYTGRSEILAFNNAYHGSTHGAMSVMGSEFFKTAYRPLLPNIGFLEFNNEDDLKKITNKTACVLVEPIQGEGGIISPKNNFLKKLRAACDKTNTLLIFDEIQTGFGRTGNLFAFQKYDVIPDIFTIAKAMGGGMPIGGFVSSNEIMNSLTNNPILGHITTFGGHPVSTAAALANLKILIDQPELINTTEKKAQLFRSELKNINSIKEIRSDGLYMAIDLGKDYDIDKLMQEMYNQGIISDLFLFYEGAFRISPPLIIKDDEIIEACARIKRSFDIVER